MKQGIRDMKPPHRNESLVISRDDDFTPQEAQQRFEATLRGALTAPPQHREAPQKTVAKKKKRGPYARASSASARSGRPGA
jgi:hypothetical protein